MVLEPSFIIDLINNFGYLGVFAGSLISSLVLFFPVPSFVFVIAAGAFLNPLAVGLAAGAGSAIGEMIGYPIGHGIRHVAKHARKKKKNKYEGRMLRVIREWFDRKRGPLIIFLFAASPLPDDFVIIFCGIIGYDIKKLFIPLLAGKIVLSLFLAYTGFYGLDFIANSL